MNRADASIVPSGFTAFPAKIPPSNFVAAVESVLPTSERFSSIVNCVPSNLTMASDVKEAAVVLVPLPFSGVSTTVAPDAGFIVIVFVPEVPATLMRWMISS